VTTRGTEVVARDSLWWLHEGNRAIRVGDWKLVVARGDPWELYDLAADRSETKDLARERPEKVKELAALWEKQWAEYIALASRDAPAAGKAPNK
jgi:arylsulfatase